MIDGKMKRKYITDGMIMEEEKKEREEKESKFS